MRYLLLLVFLVSCSGDCNKVNNPKSKDYPCGTRAHACSVNPLMCCWNTEDCGKEGTSCPAGMCCYSGEETYGVSPDAGKSFVVKQEPQWSIGTR